MVKYALAVLLGLLPFAGLPAEQSGNPSQSARYITVDKRDVPLEELAHSFLFHASDSQTLKSLISAKGIARLQPELAKLQTEMTDLRRIAPKARDMCRRLQSAKNGQEFAAVFVDAEDAQQKEMQQHARRILSTLDVNDRSALERYLDTEYRQSFNRVKFDYEAMYASASFPSPETKAITQKTCDSASQMEEKVGP